MNLCQRHIFGGGSNVKGSDGVGGVCGKRGGWLSLVGCLCSSWNHFALGRQMHHGALGSSGRLWGARGGPLGALGSSGGPWGALHAHGVPCRESLVCPGECWRALGSFGGGGWGALGGLGSSWGGGAGEPWDPPLLHLLSIKVKWINRLLTSGFKFQLIHPRGLVQPRFAL